MSDIDIELFISKQEGCFNMFQQTVSKLKDHENILATPNSSMGRKKHKK